MLIYFDVHFCLCLYSEEKQKRPMKTLVIIPSRLSATRLPGKPLRLIDGLPMIVRTCLQCLKAVQRHKLYVATDDKKIKKCCEKYI